MAVLTANFETGTDGANILAADAGSATAWNVVTVTNNSGLPPTATYSTTHVANGTLAGKIRTGTTDTIALEWSTALGTITDHYGRIYLYLTSYPVSQMPIMQFSQGGSRAARIDITGGGGALAGFDNPAAALFPTFSTPIPLNQWVRIEWHIVHSATVGSCEISMYSTASSTTPTETETGTNKNTLTNADDFTIGTLVASGGTIDLWLDNIVVNATSFPGPFTEPAVTPQVLAMQTHISGHNYF